MTAALQGTAARVVTLLVVAVILKVNASIVLVYRDYFPPNFDADFLLGRQAYFAGAYQWAFYSHILAGPFTLLFGLLLLSDWFRLRFPKWHRGIGKTQIALILVLLCPSGAWMAYYAQSGAVAGVGFAALAVATATCAVFGWRTAVRRNFAAHRRWMQRCFLLLCSAVVLRLIGGLVEVTGVGIVAGYPFAAWASWLVPLLVFELTSYLTARRLDQSFPVGSSAGFAASSPASTEIILNSRSSPTSSPIA